MVSPRTRFTIGLFGLVVIGFCMGTMIFQNLGLLLGLWAGREAWRATVEWMCRDA